jgi:hypothetical protein
MASNLISINYSNKLEWVIPDSKMDAVISTLDKYGDRSNNNSYPKTTSSDISASPCLQTDCQSSHSLKDA